MIVDSKKLNFDESVSNESYFSRFFGYFFVVVFIALLLYGGNYLLHPNTLPIKHVKVEGSFNRLSQTELKKNVVNNIRGGFFSLNVNEVRLALLSMPWVREVTVKRVWPDLLKVIVFEQVPSARWGDLGLLNLSGEYFSPSEEIIFEDLPLLFGPINSGIKLLDRYKTIQEKLQSLPFRLNVVSVILNNRRAYSFDLENGVRVVLGRHAFDERLDRFLKFVPTLIPDRINNIDSIDLRYSNGLSVFWKNKFNISSN